MSKQFKAVTPFTRKRLGLTLGDQVIKSAVKSHIKEGIKTANTFEERNEAHGR